MSNDPINSLNNKKPLSKFQKKIVRAIIKNDIKNIEDFFTYTFFKKRFSLLDELFKDGDENNRIYYNERTYYFEGFKFFKGDKIYVLNNNSGKSRDPKNIKTKRIREFLIMKVKEFLMLLNLLIENNYIICITKKQKIIPLFEQDPEQNENRTIPISTVYILLKEYLNKEILALPSLKKYKKRWYKTFEESRLILYRWVGITISIVAIIMGIIGYTLKDFFHLKQTNVKKIQIIDTVLVKSNDIGYDLNDTTKTIVK